jgi:predicted nucleic acid-binding Zn ribbon protein
MPVYTYRREDGTTFDYRQKFLDDPLTLDPETGQKVVRVVQAAGVIFKGSGFYVNDSKSASKSTSTPPKSEGKDGAESKPSEGAPAEAKSAEAKPAPVAAPAAAD